MKNNLHHEQDYMFWVAIAVQLRLVYKVRQRFITTERRVSRKDD